MQQQQQQHPNWRGAQSGASTSMQQQQHPNWRGESGPNVQNHNGTTGVNEMVRNQVPGQSGVSMQQDQHPNVPNYNGTTGVNSSHGNVSRSEVSGPSNQVPGQSGPSTSMQQHQNPSSSGESCSNVPNRNGTTGVNSSHGNGSRSESCFGQSFRNNQSKADLNYEAGKEAALEKQKEEAILSKASVVAQKAKKRPKVSNLRCVFWFVFLNN